MGRPYSGARVGLSKRELDRANLVIRFIENLTVPSGQGAGGRFLLRPFQKDFIYAVYGPTGADHRRRVRRAIFSLARKNGKTALIAALVLVHLIGPESIDNGEIYSVANDKAQAAQVFKVCTQMIRADPDLRALLTMVNSTKRIVCLHNGSFYSAESKGAETKHGFNPSVAIYDELAQAKSRDLYDVFDTSMGARAEPLFIVISTQSNDPQHVLSKLIDDGMSTADDTTVCHLYAATEECDLMDREQWIAANPALGDFRGLEDLEVLARKAVRMPAEEPKFRNLYLNQRVSPHASLISRADWTACQAEEVDLLQDGEPVWLALDMSAKVDLTALAALSAEDGDRLEAWFWKPEDTLAEHEKRDRVPYAEWVEDGWIEAIPGRSIHPRAVANTVAALCERYNVLGLAYDRWQIDHLLREFDAIGLQASKAGEGDGLQLYPWGQGFKDMSPAIDALETAILNDTLIQPGNPVLTWNMANAIATTDPAGGRKLDKSKARFRIDGAQVAAMVCGLKASQRVADSADLDDFLNNPVMVL